MVEELSQWRTHKVDAIDIPCLSHVVQLSHVGYAAIKEVAEAFSVIAAKYNETNAIYNNMSEGEQRARMAMGKMGQINHCMNHAWSAVEGLKSIWENRICLLCTFLGDKWRTTENIRNAFKNFIGILLGWVKSNLRYAADVLKMFDSAFGPPAG